MHGARKWALGTFWHQLSALMLSHSSQWCQLEIHFNESNIRLLQHILTSSFLCFNGQFYKQKNVVAIVSLLSHVIVIFFMEEFEDVAPSRAAYQPTYYFRCVDDIFMN
jgi:hypothetical protein